MTRGRLRAVHVASLVGVCALEISCGGSPSSGPTPSAALPPQALTSVWGSSATDVWAVGEEGTLLHFDGTKWNTLESGTIQDLYAVSGSGPDDVWAVGDDVIVHYDGSHTEIVMSDMFEVLLGVWVHDKDVWASGLATDYDTGMVRHFNGTKWDFTDTGSAKPLWEIWGSGPTDVWTGGTATDGTAGFLARGKPLRKAPGDGKSFSTIQFDATTYTGDAIRGIWGASRDDVWVAGYGGVTQHWDGATWTSFAALSANHLLRLGGLEKDVWAVGMSGTILHFDGATWHAMPAATTETLKAVWAAASNDAWAVGSHGTIVHWDGASWELAN